MKIQSLFGKDQLVFSFEFFPPKDDAGADALYQTIETLKQLTPSFVSVTYGAGGSTRRKTIEITERIKREIGIEAMAHLTCVGHSRGEILTLLEELEAAGIENIMALRGDPPKGETSFVPHPDGLKWTLCSLLLCICVNRRESAVKISLHSWLSQRLIRPLAESWPSGPASAP